MKKRIGVVINTDGGDFRHVNRLENGTIEIEPEQVDPEADVYASLEDMRDSLGAGWRYEPEAL